MELIELMLKRLRAKISRKEATSNNFSYNVMIGFHIVISFITLSIFYDFFLKFFMTKLLYFKIFL